LTEHDGVITLLLRGAPALGLALGPALASAGPDNYYGIQIEGKEIYPIFVFAKCRWSFHSKAW